MEGVSRKFNSWVDNKDLKLNQVLNRESKQFGPHPNRLRSCVWTLSKMSLDPIQKLTYNKGHFQKSKTHQEMRLSLNFSKSRAKFKTVFAQNRLVNNQFNEDFSKVFKPVIEQQKKNQKILFLNLHRFKQQLKIYQMFQHCLGACLNPKGRLNPKAYRLPRCQTSSTHCNWNNICLL